jgi:AbrB family looped-hinge helix DNA binding protein
MSTLEITSVSSKGQVVIPGAVRASLGIKTGTKLAVITDGESVLMRPLETPKLSAFRRLIAESRAYAGRTGLKRSDVPAAIRRVRDANRSGR